MVGRLECDQMEVKIAQILQSCLKSCLGQRYTLKVALFKRAKKLTKYLGYFWNKNLVPRTLKNSAHPVTLVRR